MPMTVDFHRIRGFQAGGEACRYTFEALVCQLARRRPPVDALEFRRVEGAGGDGGVEAYWLRVGGAETGYQAKYHLKSADINWQKIDESVKAALANHPKLDHYVIAIPCDLTDHTGKSDRGNTGWEHWTTHMTKWEGWASARNRTVTFEPWTLDTLAGFLNDPANAGLVKYWFDLPRFDAAWFQRHLDAAVADLDERFHPEDHVEVQLEAAFDGLTRHPRVRSLLAEPLSELQRAYKDFVRTVVADKEVPPEADLRRLAQCIAATEEIECFILAPVFTPWPSTEWLKQIKLAGDAFDPLFEWIWAHRRGRQSSDDEPFACMDATLVEVARSLEGLQACLFSSLIRADKTRKLLVTGTAGSGKSHLLAAVARKALSEGTPVLLLLGQHFHQGDPWAQILARLDLSGYGRDELLGALDAAAEAAGTRALILIDALNEGAGLSLWRDQLSGFLVEIERYPNLAVAVSCRSEYQAHLIPEGVLERVVSVECRGFVTPEEQEGAARQYLEKRGIVRPTTPWLAPEFTNPLFLRACCISLAAMKQTEFPRGLRGTKTVLAFHIDSVGRHLDPAHAGTDHLVGPTKRALVRLAGEMARLRRDHLTVSTAAALVAETFQGMGEAQRGSWLEALRGAGLLRRDPDPNAGPQDPFSIGEDVIRFAFQRFSDHLIAKALLEGLPDPVGAFADGGVLSFLIRNNEIDWPWFGVVDALAIQLPESHHIELVDVLPGGEGLWWIRYETVNGFKESALWRSPDAFTERTRELLNALPTYSETHHPHLDLLIQLAVVVDHPWNARMLDRNLGSWPMPERDAAWSIALADATVVEDHPIHRLIDWAWHADKSRATDETLRLTALVLTWCFTTPSRPIRDRATKALSSVLDERPSLFPDLVKHFAEVDDPYITERLFAAAYGVACTRPERKALEAMAAATHDFGFAQGLPPAHLLTRDYMLGILEAAEAFGALPPHIDIARCRPPFATNWPLKGVTAKQVEAIAKKAGDKSILLSAGDWGDFGRYEINPGVGYFTRVPRSKPEPLTADGKLKRFEDLFIGDDAEKREQLQKLKDAAQTYHSARFRVHFRRFGDEIEEDGDETLVGENDDGLDALVAQIDAAEATLLSSLSKAERRLYREFALPALRPDLCDDDERLIPKFDVAWAQRWVIKRAYGFGWTKAQFPREPTDYKSTQRSTIERVGKKYQWIALYELLARLSDHLWVKHWSDGGVGYSNPNDLGIQRDIDPTVFIQGRDHPKVKPVSPWWLPKTPEFPPVTDAELLDWPFRDGEVINGRELIDLTGPDGNQWLVLHSFLLASETVERSVASIPFRRDQFTRICPLIVRAEVANRVIAAFQGKHLSNSMAWNPPEITDTGFLFEAPWRATWADSGWETDVLRDQPTVAVIRPVVGYHWESHLDAALPEGARVSLPNPWLAKAMGLRPRPTAPGEYEDQSGRLVFHDPAYGTPHSSAAAVAREPFLRFLTDNGLTCLWLVGGERNAWPDGSRDRWSCRYHSGIYHWSGDDWVEERWHDDERRDRKTEGR